ncbi:non-homologous end-joining DNA ligase [Actinopolymorpha sp. B11F2]|uniref:non-homologous end-joining DNA ligase n=1 Tax=Actinopolymorpha sp. B11F2 TaxID=3160862 RepID=UPI0032E3F91A
MADEMPDPLDVLGDDERRLLRRAPRPGWQAPMLATLTKKPFSDERWIYERKLDGVRVIAVRSRGQTTLWSRNHKDMTSTYPEIVQAFAPQQAQDFVADGEIVAFDGRQTSFAKLQARINLADPRRIPATGVTVYLYLFDLLVVGDADLTRLPLRARKRVLRTTFEFGDRVRFSTHRNTEGERFHADACARGWEGLIAKRADAPYQTGRRSRDWLKFKCVRDQEFVIGGFTDPEGSRQGFGALLVGYYEGNRLRYAGKVGTGYNALMLRDLRARMDKIAQSSSPFADPVRERSAHWVGPELVAQIGFTEWTSDGKLRHPRFVGLRTDKDASEVVREQ